MKYVTKIIIMGLSYQYWNNPNNDASFYIKYILTNLEQANKEQAM